MNSLPSPWWPVAVLAIILLVDALMSIRPPTFIRQCLEGVKFPEEWWWVLIAVKLLAVGGLTIGIWVDGIALAATGGVIAYFVVASIAHIRAEYCRQEFWVNCLGMLLLSIAVLIGSFAL